jgi:hypothetical protein
MTFLEVANAIQTWAGVDTTRLPTATAKQIVNWVTQDFCRKYNTPWNQDTGNVVLAAGDDTYTKPDGWKEPRRAYYLDSDGDPVELEYYQSMTALDEDYPPSGLDTYPLAYSQWWDGVVIRPKTSGGTTVWFDLYVFVEDLVNDADANDWTVYHPQLVIFRALADYVSQYLFEDPRIPVWTARANALEAEFAVEHKRNRHAAERPVTVERH